MSHPDVVSDERLEAKALAQPILDVDRSKSIYPPYVPKPPPYSASHRYTSHSRHGPPPGADPQLWQFFASVDIDRSGSITVTELQKALVNGTVLEKIHSFCTTESSI